MKKLLSILLFCCMLTGCGTDTSTEKKSQSEKTSESSVTEAVQEETEETTEATTEETTYQEIILDGVYENEYVTFPISSEWTYDEAFGYPSWTTKDGIVINLKLNDDVDVNQGVLNTKKSLGKYDFLEYVDERYSNMRNIIVNNDVLFELQFYNCDNPMQVFEEMLGQVQIFEPKPTESVIAEQLSVVLNDYFITENDDGEPVIIFNLNYTNRTDEAESFAWNYSFQIFQNGIECDDLYSFEMDDIDLTASQKDVLPGFSIDIQEAFYLTDMSPIAVLITDVYDDSDVIISCIIDLETGEITTV